MRSNYTVWGSVGLTLGLTVGAGSSAFGQSLNGVTAERTPHGLEILVMGEGLKRPNVVRNADGKEITFKFKGVLQGTPGKQEFASGSVRAISYGWVDKRTKESGLIAKLKTSTEPKIKEMIGGWVIRFEEPVTPKKAASTTAPRANAEFSPIYREDELFASFGSPAGDLGMLPPALPLNIPMVRPTIGKVPIEFIMAVPTLFKGTKSKPTSTPSIFNDFGFSDKKAPIKKLTEKKPTEIAHPVEDKKAVDAKPSEVKKAPDKKDKPTDPMNRLVSLDFTNTDVIQILKAITLQAGVNIVAAKDVNQSISVSLDKVTVLQALDVVAQVAKLSYRKQGNVYVVSPLTETSVGPVREPDPAIANRIVPIISGQGKEIRAMLTAWLKAQPSMHGYEVFLPQDNFSIEKAAAPAGGAQVNDIKLQQSAASESRGESAASSTDAAVRFNGLKDQYLMVIGPSGSMDMVVRQVTEADHMIAKAYGMTQKSDDPVITHSYAVHTEKTTAADLVKAMSSNGSSLNVDLIASPKDFINQVVLVVGRESNVVRAEEMLGKLDSSGYGSQTFTYEVKSTDPRSLREALVSAVPGLRVTVAPNPVSNSSLFKEGEGKKQGSDVLNAQSAAGQQQQSQASSGVAGSSTSAISSDGALEAPFAESEKNAFPMRLFLRGTPAQIGEARALIEQMDVAPKQVAIELRVMELTKDDSINAGIDWNILGGGAVKFVNLNNSATTPSNTIGGSITGKKFSGDITASLDALATHNKLLARPNFSVVDGRQGEVFVGDIVRYIQSVTQSQSGTTIVTGEVSVGVRLCVMPRVGGDGKITLDLRPRISLLKGFTDVPNGGKLPQTSSRYAQTTLMVDSGQTIAIGGLIQDQDSMITSGVPFLQDLPILGHFFKSSKGERKRTELVIFLTVKTIDNAANGENLYMPSTPPQPEAKTKKGAKKGK